MSRIFDNIQQELLQALRSTLQVSKRADFCIGYLNLRGWQAIDDLIGSWNSADGQVCRVLVGMQRPPHDEIRELYRQSSEEGLIDNATASRLKAQFAVHLREQITLGIPTGQDEAGLRRLARQLRAGQVVVKLFLPYPLHAKLYLLFRDDVNNPITGFVGSSNLTLAGLSKHGELNVDVLDHLGTEKLASWFSDRWGDRWALDVSADLAAIIESSWAREEAIPPHHIYLNIAYLYQLAVPRLRSGDAQCESLAKRAASLICTAPEFDDLAKSVGLAPTTRDGQTTYGTTAPTERAKLRAELDGLVAHLYGLDEEEFAHILKTFPLVPEPAKVAALNAWRDVKHGLIS